MGILYNSICTFDRALDYDDVENPIGLFITLIVAVSMLYCVPQFFMWYYGK